MQAYVKSRGKYDHSWRGKNSRIQKPKWKVNLFFYKIVNLHVSYGVYTLRENINIGAINEKKHQATNKIA